MNRMTKLIAAGTVALAAAGIGTGIAVATGNDDTESPITGEALDRATAAALAHTGGGRVTDTEVGDEESLYEVEVTLEDGSTVDVQLDKTFHVVGEKVDNENERDDN